MKLLTCFFLLFLLEYAVYAQTCSNGAVRLTSGSTYGAVEVCLNNGWGSICRDFWNNEDASVICRQLGYSPYGAIGPSATYYSSSTISHKMIDVNCTGAETNIINCPYNGYSSYPCSLSRDANVFCTVGVSSSSCTTGDVRLLGGSTDNDGRVEVCVNNAWSSVCTSSGWNRQAAQVICNQVGDNFVCGQGNSRVDNNLASVVCSELGYSRYGAKSATGLWYNYDLFNFFNIRCSGVESSILGCQYNTVGTCSSSSAIGVVCSHNTIKAPVNCTDGSIRLYGGSSATEGILHVCANGAWGTVCSGYWDNQDNAVACRQLGFLPYGYETHSSVNDFPAIFSYFSCQGTESNLYSCRYTGLSYAFCTNRQVIKVTCEEQCKENAVRLDGGSNYYGRVQFCTGGEWRTICTNYWDNKDASVVCRQLGYSPYGALVGEYSWFSSSLYTNVLRGVNCVGNETRLQDCPTDSSASCGSSYYHATVICPVHGTVSYSNCTDGEVRLFGGSTEYEGTVEICRNSAWGTISYYSISDFTAQTICNQLGYTAPGATGVRYSYFGEGSGPILMGYVYCSSVTTSLSNCYNLTYYITYYSHYYDIGVRCESSCTNGDIRLIGSSNPLVGRVEVCFDETWGTNM
ncbi:PREDICTED: scavenger receptor cysteine-rich domain superfamily protein-like [Amphimedon queenslandica]|uniref:SRCR domain-containing protein n=1 Tax=Amphimedon queenslandica TaxID=400682 RepID=A0AAN0JRV7_AMPQE|nr:PREDICTED: scavenger receptor cysteine-rich domain superfamily protein-like [Amphimedon queenslandica]|eukprot:XP_019859820.1 PREDICTED: scavenger receptor cysteine-rich domain superfamily protein-like [Amphimedon queenslandica]